MDNIQRDFRTKANMSTGFYNPDGSQSRSFGFKPDPAPPNSGPQRPAPPNSGPQRPAPPNSGPQMPARPNSGPQMPAAPNTGPQRPGLLARAGRMVERGIQPPDWKGLGKKAIGVTKGAAGKVLQNMNTVSNAIAAGDDLGAVWAAPNADLVEKVGGTAEALGNVAGGFLLDRAVRGAGIVVPALAGASNMGLANSRPVTALSRMVNGRSAIDNIRNDAGFGEAKNPMQLIGETAMSASGRTANSPKTPGSSSSASPQPAPLSPELQRVKDSTFDANSDPFTRRADPEAELARQQRNFASAADGGNGLGGAVESAFHAQRGKFSDGRKAFADEDTRALFNTNQALQGTGIQAEKQANGVTEFSGSNVTGLGGKLYRAADGSVTNDWSKTKDYADQIQRNAQDQSRLAELTRGAALSGDKEAVARLTAGDGRLQAIAADAATERDLRQAVRGGSAKAAQVLATMESARATAANQQADLGLRRAALVGAQEDRDLNRQLRQDALAERVASNQRDQNLKGVETLDKQLEQYATVDGKLDGEKLSRIRGLAANLQKTPGQTDESYRKDVTTLVSLATKLDGGQAFYDRWFSQAGRGGTDLRAWKKNESWRGGLVTDQGDHFSARQWNALTDDEKRIAKLLGMKGEM